MLVNTSTSRSLYSGLSVRAVKYSHRISSTAACYFVFSINHGPTNNTGTTGFCTHDVHRETKRAIVDVGYRRLSASSSIRSLDTHSSTTHTATSCCGTAPPTSLMNSTSHGSTSNNGSNGSKNTATFRTLGEGYTSSRATPEMSSKESCATRSPAHERVDPAEQHRCLRFEKCYTRDSDVSKRSSTRCLTSARWMRASESRRGG